MTDYTTLLDKLERPFTSTPTTIQAATAIRTLTRELGEAREPRKVAVISGTPLFRLAEQNEALRAELTDTKARLAEAVGIARGIADDYQTSTEHHPDHVLINRPDFDALQAFLAKQEPKP